MKKILLVMLLSVSTAYAGTETITPSCHPCFFSRLGTSIAHGISALGKWASSANLRLKFCEVTISAPPSFVLIDGSVGSQTITTGTSTTKNDKPSN